MTMMMISTEFTKEFFDKIRDESKEDRLYIYTTNYDRVLETYWEGIIKITIYL